MEKKQFHTILTNYTALTREEAEVLISLEREFPYSQVIHSLAARATQDNQLPESVKSKPTVDTPKKSADKLKTEVVKPKVEASKKSVSTVKGKEKLKSNLETKSSSKVVQKKQNVPRNKSDISERSLLIDKVIP